MPRPDFDPTGTVSVLGYEFTVAQAPPGSNGLVNEGRSGFCDHHGGAIVVSDHLGPDRKAETVLHEIVHAAEDAVAAGLDEDQVNRIARVLYAVCRDNPSYMRGLLFPD